MKENRRVGTWTVDVMLDKNGDYDVYIEEVTSNLHYTGLLYSGIKLNEIGQHLCDDIKCYTKDLEQ